MSYIEKLIKNCREAQQAKPIRKFEIYGCIDNHQNSFEDQQGLSEADAKASQVTRLRSSRNRNG
jgi:hypothetical protein